MSHLQMLNQSFSAVYTNSTINIKHHLNDNNQYQSSKHTQTSTLKFIWRRLYGDMINLSISTGHQYFCSPLDWNALIQVQIQKNGILIDKSVYGPILLEQRLKEKVYQSKKNKYKAWISINQSSPKSAEIIIFKQSPNLFEVNIGEAKLQFDKKFMERRGWNTLNCLPDSGILMIQAQHLKSQWSNFLQQIKIKSFQGQQNNKKDALSIVFTDRIQRDQFLIKIIQETTILKKEKSTKNLKNIATYATDKKLRQNPQESKNASHFSKQQLDDSIVQILDNDNVVGNRTMQDIFDLLYTPTQSVSNSPQKCLDNSANKSSKMLNSLSKNSYHDLFKKFDENNRGFNHTLTQTKPRKASKQKLRGFKDRKCSVSINFKNPEEDINNTDEILFEYDYDPEIDVFLKNPHKIKDLLKKAKKLNQQNKKLKIQIEELKKQKQQVKKKEAANEQSNNDIKVLKNMIEQINSQMNYRIVSLQQKVSKGNQRPTTFHIKSRKDSDKNITHLAINNHYNYEIRKNSRQAGGIPNFIKNNQYIHKTNNPSQIKTHTQQINKFMYGGVNSYHDSNQIFDTPLSPPPLLQYHKGQSSIQIQIDSPMSNNNEQIKMGFPNSNNTESKTKLNFHNDHQKKRYINNQTNSFKLNNVNSTSMLKFRASPLKSPTNLNKQFKYK